MDIKKHWERVYDNKQFSEMSWYQPVPQVSLDFVQELHISQSASVIDIGGGDSFFVDHLLNLGYTDVTVLDISEAAINRAKQRLGEKAALVHWIVSDVCALQADRQFDFWHDRAAFHFLTTEQEVDSYLAMAEKHISSGGKMVIGTFSAEGPEKCSGLPVKKYSEHVLSQTLQRWFSKIRCLAVDHITPFNTIQNFLFCSFQKINYGHS